MKAKKIFKSALIPAIAGVGLALSSGSAVAACGSGDYLGSICPVGFNFCPRSTMEADGRLLAINSNQALFALFGTMYGGDGRTTFALPDLRGRSPIGLGQGPGLSSFTQGQRGRAQTVTLTTTQLPNHSHSASTSVSVSVDSKLRANSASGDDDDPTGNVLAKRSRMRVYSSAGANEDMSPDAIDTTVSASATTTVGNTGGSQSFGLRDPYLAIRYCVVLQGIFPSRN